MARMAELRNLKVYFYDQRDKQFIRAVENVSFQVDEGSVLGVVGESGSGKTVTALSMMGLLGSEPGIIDGEFFFRPRREDSTAVRHALERGVPPLKNAAPPMNDGNLLNLFHGLRMYVTFEQDPFTIVKDTEKWFRRQERIMLHIRGKNISMVFQNPRLSLNPFVPVGRQIERTLTRFGGAATRSEAKEQATGLLRAVRLNQPELVMNMYPDSLSVGMAQRVVLAIAISSNPKLLVADEPTTGLDTTNTRKVTELLLELKKERNLTLILISHDLGIVGDIADRIVVMYAGHVVEHGSRGDVLREAGGEHHPYTKALLGSIPRETDMASAKRLEGIAGRAPDNRSEMRGCPFRERCPEAAGTTAKKCASECPEFHETSPGHFIRCHLSGGAGTAAPGGEA